MESIAFAGVSFKHVVFSGLTNYQAESGGVVLGVLLGSPNFERAPLLGLQRESKGNAPEAYPCEDGAWGESKNLFKG